MAAKKTSKSKDKPWALVSDLTIFTIAEAHRLLVSRFNDDAPLAIDLSKVENCDTAGVQLLQAAVKTAEIRGKSLGFCHVPPVVTDAWMRNGLDVDMLNTAGKEATDGKNHPHGR